MLEESKMCVFYEFKKVTHPCCHGLDALLPWSCVVTLECLFVMFRTCVYFNYAAPHVVF